MLNSLFIYFVLRRTPPQLKSYSIFLLNFAMADFIACSTSMLAIQKPIFSGMALTYIFHGFCGKVGAYMCYLSHCVGCHAYAHSQWILMASFIYRYYVLSNNQPTMLKIILVCLLFYIPSLIFLIGYSLDGGSSTVLKNLLIEYHPEYDFSNDEAWADLVVSGNESVISVITATAIIYMCCPCAPIYAIILKFRRKTLATLDDAVLSMSEASKRMHRLLITALTIQACIPIFYVTAASMYLFNRFHLIGGPIVENTIFRLMECMPVLTPLVSFYFVTPYKQTIENWLVRLGIRSKKEDMKRHLAPLSTTVTDSTAPTSSTAPSNATSSTNARTNSVAPVSNFHRI